jgi:hypothetical protein
VGIATELVEESWAREVPLLPYHIYVKIAYHLAQELVPGIRSSAFRPNSGAACSITGSRQLKSPPII